MKQNLEALNNLPINFDEFYSIRVTQYDITLMAWLTEKIVRDLELLGIEFSYDQKDKSLYFAGEIGTVKTFITLSIR